MKKRYERIEGYEIAGCAAFDKNLVSLWGQQWLHSDPLDQRLTCIFFFYADEPEVDQWAFSGIGGATGIYGCAGKQPARQWIYVMDDGAVYTVGGGVDDFESSVIQGRLAFFSNVCSIRSGDVLAVGGRRKVYLRKGAGRWQPLGQGFSPQDEGDDLTDAGFRDADGFSLDEVYAVGGRGDAWVCLSGQWQPIELGTNVGLKRVLCTRGGQVVIAADRHELYVGRHDQSWHRVSHDLTDEVHESLVDFEGRILLSTSHHLLELINGQIVSADFPNMPKMNCVAHLGAGDGVLVVAGRDEAVIFDGVDWLRILDPKP